MCLLLFSYNYVRSCYCHITIVMTQSCTRVSEVKACARADGKPLKLNMATPAKVSKEDTENGQKANDSVNGNLLVLLKLRIVPSVLVCAM